LIERRLLWPDLSVDHNYLRTSGLELTPNANAEFGTRHADIRIDIALVGSPPTATSQGSDKIRGNIRAFTYNGSIVIDMFEIHDDRCVELDAFSQQGDIVVLLPPTFNGTISLRQWQAKLNLLPGFSARKSVVRQTSLEIVMMLGRLDGSGTPIVPQGDDADRCVISSPAGRITVGLSGVDVYDGPIRRGGLIQAVSDVVHFGAKLVEETLGKR